MDPFKKFFFEGNFFNLTYSRYGLVLLKNSSLDQAIEIVINEYDNSVFLKVDEVKKIWNY